ncbi:M20 family metallopeptidase [Methylobacterium terricola]|uniref:M20 family metallopeptidase n=1 Tax=Methylobacterium terricola TaxID=2583531 RepID=A0A5C4LFQ1_9HYPH|nr:M20 family metallopeptidase [Methylobacterium terricola]TNC11588.1 M20 family metallopeptidase [Methylobacterium terricola]
MTLNDRERAVLAWLADRHDAMADLLAEIVAIDSGSRDKPGIDRVGAVLRRSLAGAGIPTRVIAHPDHGDNLLAELPGDAPGGHALLLGHMDTVFPAGTAAERPFRIADGVATGPGVADMKAGLVMNLFVAQAFAATGGAPMPLSLLCTGDEEIASPASRPVIEAAARGAALVLNAEPGRASGNVVTRRKGALFLRVAITGRAAHSGVEPGKGASAIDAMARKILKLHALQDLAAGTTVNVGLASGGVTVNTVAPQAGLEIDVRFRDHAAMRAVRQAIEAIVAEEEPAGTRARIVDDAGFLPLVESEAGQALFSLYAGCARDIGFAVEGEFTGGSADSGFTASVGAPTLCATGPVGGGAHTPEEYCRLDTMVPRAQAAALTILRAPSSRVPQTQVPLA